MTDLNVIVTKIINCFKNVYHDERIKAVEDEKKPSNFFFFYGWFSQLKHFVRFFASPILILFQDLLHLDDHA